MSKLPAVKPKKLLKILQKQGFYIHHQRGSHIVLKHAKHSLIRVTLPLHIEAPRATCPPKLLRRRKSPRILLNQKLKSR